MFYDINKFEPGKGILRLPISMARIANAQSAKAYFEEYLQYLNPSKIRTPTVGVQFCYGDTLYLYNPGESCEKKKTYMSEIIKHKNEGLKYLSKPYKGNDKYSQMRYIKEAFSFSGRTDLYINYEGDIFTDLQRLLKIYKEDTYFQKLLYDDCRYLEIKDISENQIMFFLEEHLIMYFILKGRISIRNEYIKQPNWILICYPGMLLKHQIYIIQKNFRNIDNSKNAYEYGWYNLADKVLYKINRIDVEEYEYKNS